METGLFSLNNTIPRRGQKTITRGPLWTWYKLCRERTAPFTFVLTGELLWNLMTAIGGPAGFPRSSL